MDDWEKYVFRAEFGGWPLNVLDSGDSAPFRVVEHELPGSNGSPTQPNGRPSRRVTLSLLWVDLAEFTDFANWLSANGSEPHQFVHPLTGSMEARPGQWDFQGDAQRRCVTATLELIEATEEPAILDVADSNSAQAGVADVSEASENVIRELEQAELDSDVSLQALESVNRWATSELTRYEVEVESGGLKEYLGSEALRLGLTADIGLFPVLQSFITLGAAIDRAARVTVATQPQLQTWTVSNPQPLLALTAELYGAASAMKQFSRILAMNSIDSPGLLPAGTTLVIESPG